MKTLDKTQLKTTNDKVVAYGGTFGKTLITKEYFMETWRHTLNQLQRLPDTLDELQEILKITERLQAMVREKSEVYITQAEADALGLTKYKPE